MSPDSVFGKSSFRSPIIQDWVSGSFFVPAFAGSTCTILLYASRSELNKNRESLRRFKYKGDFMKPMLLDFSATWCGPCRMQKPILEELEKKYGDKVEFKVVDVDENQELASKYGIHAVPTLIIQKDGTEVKRFMGVTQGSVLASELDKIL